MVASTECPGRLIQGSRRLSDVSPWVAENAGNRAEDVADSAGSWVECPVVNGSFGPHLFGARNVARMNNS